MPENEQDTCSINEFRHMFLRLLEGFPSSVFSYLRNSDPRFPHIFSHEKQPPFLPRWSKKEAWHYALTIFYENQIKYHEIRRQREPVYLQIFTGYRSFLKYRRTLIRKNISDKSPLLPAEISRFKDYMRFVKDIKDKLEVFFEYSDTSSTHLNSSRMNRDLLRELKYAVKMLDEFHWRLQQILRNNTFSFSKLSIAISFSQYGPEDNAKIRKLRNKLSCRIRALTDEHSCPDAELKICRRKLYLLSADLPYCD